jgi:hypothetical protein
VNLEQYCGTAERRQRVLDSQVQIGALEINGIDYLEVLDQDAPSEALRQRLIDLVFLKADGVLVVDSQTPLFDPDMIVIEGGPRARKVRVTEVSAGSDAQTLRLTLDGAGDFSSYRLRLRAAADDDSPPATMDLILSSIDFSFKADCPTDFDCAPPAAPARAAGSSPSLDYLAKDYESFRQLMLDRMAVTLPEWDERSPADLGVTLVEALAYAADMASYYQDGVATEAYLSLARRRESVRRHARLLGYRIGEGTNARTWIAINVTQDSEQVDPPLLPAGTLLITKPAQKEVSAGLDPAISKDPAVLRDLLNAGSIVFETMENVTKVKTARNEILFHTWGDSDCCLPAGTTFAHLVGMPDSLDLEAGDVLILEERLPRGGTVDDPARPDHRQAVRISEAPKPMIDLLDDTPVLEIRWHDEDALQFPLNLAGVNGSPGAVARANVVLADHGRTLDYVYANTAGENEVNVSLHASLTGSAGLDPSSAPGSGVYRPKLSDGQVTRAEPFDTKAARGSPATVATLQNAGLAVPQVTLVGGGEDWIAQPDLLGSDRFSAEFVLETANDGSATIRFGDGQFGKSPAAEASFLARVRVGNGPMGLIGADSIGHIITDDPDLISKVTNPLPAEGGAPPEHLIAAKISAPRAFRTQKRAVTAADYSASTSKHEAVQRAVTERRWTGSWYTMFVAVDPRDEKEVDQAFEDEIRSYLEPLRLAGHDLEIERPKYVALDIALVVCVDEGHYAAEVEAALLNAFSSKLQLDGTRGFFHPDNFTFGTPVRLSKIIAHAMAVPGVKWIGMRLEGIDETGHFRRLDDPSTDYAETGILPTSAREVARLDNDPNVPENGRLRFVMEGGG